MNLSERLRVAASGHLMIPDALVCEAADEIERLQACVDDETGKAWMDHCKELADECFQHKAKIERLQGERDDLLCLCEHINHALWPDPDASHDTNAAPAEIERLQAQLRRATEQDYCSICGGMLDEAADAAGGE